MNWYKIKCLSAGENILAQKILFEKGYRWADGKQNPLFTAKGQNLYFKEEGREITRSALNSGHFERDQSHTQVNLPELIKL